MIFNCNTNIKGSILLEDPAAAHAAAHLKRDRDQVFLCSQEETGELILEQTEEKAECFVLKERAGSLILQAGDSLGFVYGIYEISRRFLGVENFWFWNEQHFIKKEQVKIPEGYQYRSKPFSVKLRGWFVNDEVLLHGWQIDRSQTKPWEMVFEALLRCGGNMVIPGTDQNSRKYCGMASAMGLWITHHHAEPLGAEMFARCYPDKNPSYREYPELFQGLWEAAIMQQKGQKTVWNLGFRGQGDCPFWESDPEYATAEERGTLLSSILRLQYDMVKQNDPKALLCTNLYGEIMELYQEGVLHIPPDVIKIWADNGYGKMVSRRQNNHNPRISALPSKEGGTNQHHGIYYHASFYDLQAANHITMLPNSMEFVQTELQEVSRRGANDYWLINCSNVKPHTYPLDYIAAMWRDEQTEAADHRDAYVHAYYGSTEASREVADRLQEYAAGAIAYGTKEDEHAGEQFANYTTRILAGHWMKGGKEAATQLLWAVQTDSLADQITWYEDLCKCGSASYERYLDHCQSTRWKLGPEGRSFYEHSILLQAEIYHSCYQGASYFCRAFTQAQSGDYARAFYLTGRARDCYQKADTCLRESEFGKWHGFYANDCLCDCKQTAWVLEMLMGYLRNLGDGPYFYAWQREFLYPEEDRRVCLLTNLENHLDSEKLYGLMRERWG